MALQLKGRRTTVHDHVCAAAAAADTTSVWPASDDGTTAVCTQSSTERKAHAATAYAGTLASLGHSGDWDRHST